MKKIMSSKVGTIANSLLNGWSAVVALGLISRFWSENEFLRFTIDLRYLSTAATIASMSVGVSIIYFGTKYSIKNILFHNVTFINSLSVILVSMVVISVTDTDVISAFVWIFAFSYFHCVNSSIRYYSNATANSMAIVAKSFAIFLSVLIAVQLGLGLDWHFIIYGLFVVSISCWYSSKSGLEFYKSCSFSERLTYSKLLYGHAKSRAVDNAARVTIHAAPVAIVDMKYGPQVAGVIALAVVASKAMESALQPIVLHMHRDRVIRKSSVGVKLLYSSFVKAVFLSMLTYLFLSFFGESMIGLWLSSPPERILFYLKITLLSIPFIVLVQLVKGELEGESEFSPFLYANISILVVMVSISPLYRNADDVLIAYVLLLVVRALYGIRLIYKSRQKPVNSNV